MSQTSPEPEFCDDDQDRVPEQFDHRHGVDNFGFEVLTELAFYAPSLVDSGGLTATTCGYYGMTPDAVPLIGHDARLSNLVHAPITAVLVEKLIAGDTEQGRVRLRPRLSSTR